MELFMVYLWGQCVFAVKAVACVVRTRAHAVLKELELMRKEEGARQSCSEFQQLLFDICCTAAFGVILWEALN